MPAPERQRRAPLWLLVLILLALLALIAGAIAARAWSRRTAAPNPASAATVVAPGPTPTHQYELPAELRAGAYTVVLRERNPLVGEARRSRQPLTVQSGQSQPPSSGAMELTRG